ncbi:hypothetical protein Dimus_004960 [Dionaea muscipula]
MLIAVTLYKHKGWTSKLAPTERPKMWSFASSALSRTFKWKENHYKDQDVSEGSDDENASREEGLECPICWESFNLVENVPYVLWCGHTLCKNCVLGLPWATPKLGTLPFQLPLFISCPWCNLMSFRLVYNGTLRFPKKNYFILWMVESMNGERARSFSSFQSEHRQQPVSSTRNLGVGRQTSVVPNNWESSASRLVEHQGGRNLDPGHMNNRYIDIYRLNMSLCKSWALFVRATAKLPLIVIFLVITLYAIPASVAILALFLIITVVFAIPSFLMLYFAYPCLDWLVREIIR